ncbi:MAG: trimeric intracellular cation channel family protein [Gammaproteobacteria bacterium]|nr:trimeric intracellular cation channel family protein [Gammaproteobacteria bacterium]MDH5619717.1 trimeric intracellular cation channel family protein [Gammaproteobacteria bacterium]
MNFVYSLEMLGTAAFAVSGALAASRKRMDIFGFCVLALMPAVGGGTIRDIIIDRVPVFWVSDNRYVAVAVIAALVVFFAPHQRPGIRREILVWADALGLALFAALGTEICLQHDTGPLVAVMLGVTTAVTGGMIRDVICNEIPLILSREIYATAAFAASLAYVLADRMALGDNVALTVGVITGLAIRGLAILYNWSLPPFGSSR